MNKVIKQLKIPGYKTKSFIVSRNSEGGTPEQHGSVQLSLPIFESINSQNNQSSCK